MELVGFADDESDSDWDDDMDEFEPDLTSLRLVLIRDLPREADPINIIILSY